MPGAKRKRTDRRLLSVRTLRRLMQVLSLLFFLYLFIGTVGTVDLTTGGLRLLSLPPTHIYLNADPLLSVGTLVAAHKWIPSLALYAVPVLLLTLLLGRVFCGWLCPLGTTIDTADWLFRRKQRQKERPPNPRAKFYVLVALAATALLSAQLIFLFDPIALLTRTLALFIFAPVQMVVRVFSPGAGSGGIFPEGQAFFRANVISLVLFSAIIGLGSLSRRYWCRGLCPLGALLAFLSRYSLLRRICASGCTDCGVCIRNCRTGAIAQDPRHYSNAECIYCYDCTQVCPQEVVSIPLTGGTPSHPRSLNLNRRRLLQGLGLGVTWALLAKTNASAKLARDSKVKLSSAQLIRPPAALPEDEFLDRCVRCGACMKACPTGGLQPAIAEAGLEGFWSPVLVPKIGECTEMCNLCSQVCPTGAIQPFKISDKKRIFLGSAVIDRSQCIVWNSGRRCVVCEEVCSYRAVHHKAVDGVDVPFVDVSKCVGCGICENNCPVSPVAAIRVFSLGEDYRMKGRRADG